MNTPENHVQPGSRSHLVPREEKFSSISVGRLPNGRDIRVIFLPIEEDSHVMPGSGSDDSSKVRVINSVNPNLKIPRDKE